LCTPRCTSSPRRWPRSRQRRCEPACAAAPAARTSSASRATWRNTRFDVRWCSPMAAWALPGRWGRMCSRPRGSAWGTWATTWTSARWRRYADASVHLPINA
jgi:hypothetical protein